MRQGSLLTKQTLTILCVPHLVVEVSVQPQDVGVPQVRLDLDLSPQLVLHVRLLQLGFEQHLHRVVAFMRLRMRTKMQCAHNPRC